MDEANTSKFPIIRIGNDIKLTVSLHKKGTSWDPVNIKSLEAYIINTTAQCECCKKNHNISRFINRFPVEPYIEAFTPTEHNINSTGYPMWRAFPKDHVFAGYAGFGVYPDWNRIYNPMPEQNFTEYKAIVKSTSDKGKVQVLFPAEQQLFAGMYKLVIVAKIYEPGYSQNNLRTITMDYNDIFMLRSGNKSCGCGCGCGCDQGDVIDNPVDITIDWNESSSGTSEEEKFVERGEYKHGQHTIELDYNTGGNTSINIEKITKWVMPDSE